MDSIILVNRKSRGFFDTDRYFLIDSFKKRFNASVNSFSDPFPVDSVSSVFVAGGDGSFDIALNNSFLKDKTIGFIPFGAGNAVHYFLNNGVSFRNLPSSSFKKRSVDVLELSFDGVKHETLFFGIGFDADVVRFSKRSSSGFFDYISGIMRSLFSPTRHDFVCNVDGKDFSFNNCISFSLGKVPYYGYGLRSIPGSIIWDDGFVYGFAYTNSLHFLLNKIVRFVSGFLVSSGFDFLKKGKVKGRNIVISSKYEFPVHAGGEFLGFTKRISVNIKRRQDVWCL